MNAERTKRPQLAAVVAVSMLLLSGFAGTGVALSPVDNHETATEPLRTLNGTRSQTLTVETNAAVGLTLRNDALDDRLATLAQREQLATSTSANQTTVLTDELRTIRKETNQLTTREAEALERHALRNVTTEELLYELARIDASAQQLEHRHTAAVTRLDDLSATGVDTWKLRADLMTLQGPVRAQVADVAVGAVNESVVSVEASAQSLTLETRAGTDTIVERYDAGYLDATADEPATIEGVTDLIATTYPTEWENRTGYTIRRIDADLLYVEFEYTDGTIVAYIDRPTARIFKEFHYGLRSSEFSSDNESVFTTSLRLYRVTITDIRL